MHNSFQIQGLMIFFILFASSFRTVIAAEDELTDGAEIYHDYCSVCHGDRGDGNSRAKDGLITQPRDFTLPGLSEVLTRDSMIDTVKNGRPGTAMTGWTSRLDDRQVESVVDFIRREFMDQAITTEPEQTETVSTAPLKNGLVGNYDEGRKFYDNNCATCHGLKGDGNGPRAYFIFPKPRNFISETSRLRLNRAVLFNAVKYGIRGKEMPAWGKVIDDQQIADVVEYVFQAMILTDPHAAVDTGD